MAKQKLKEFHVDGTSTQIWVEESGDFCAQLDGEWAKAGTLKSLTEKIKRHVRTSRQIAVPVTLLNDYGADDTKFTIQQVTLTGIHGGSGNVIAKDDKTGETQQLRYFYGTTTRRLTGEEIQQFVALVKLQWEARRRVEEWVEARTINARDLVTKAAATLDPALDAQTLATEQAE